MNSLAPVAHRGEALAAGSVPDSINIAAHLSHSAARVPGKPAVMWPSARSASNRAGFAVLTFHELEQEVDRLAHAFERIGITRGTRTIVLVRPGGEFFAITFALFRTGAIPVLIDPGMGRRAVVECLRHIEAGAFIGTPLAQLLRMTSARAFRSVRTVVTVGQRWGWGGHTLRALREGPARPLVTAPTRRDDVAAILFTSGSTGPAKGVVYEHGMFDAQVGYLRTHYGYAADDVDLATFPLFALFDAALGVTAVIPEMDSSRPGRADPRKIIEAILTCHCTQMFGSPALLDNLARFGQRRAVRLPSIRRVITAGAPVRPVLLEALRAMLPGDAAVHTPYGATEALPVSEIESREVLSGTRHATARGAGTCVGRPLAGIDVRIIEISDEPIAGWRDARELPCGRIGEIVVRGPVVTREYFRNPHATAAAKIVDERVGGIWHRMGDVGYLDERGRLWFCGRKSQRVVTRLGTLFTEPCEGVFNESRPGLRTALVGVGAAGAMTPVICVERGRDTNRADRARIVRELLEVARSHEITHEIATILPWNRPFPVDPRHNAKIRREVLARRAARRLARSPR